MEKNFKISGYDYIEFYVGSAKVYAYFLAKAMGMQIVGYKGPETGCRASCSYLMSLNEVSFLVTSKLQPASSEIGSFVDQHGDGVKRWAIKVDNVEAAFAYFSEKGGIPICLPRQLGDENGEITEAAFKLYDDTEIVLLNRSNYRGLFMPGFGKPPQSFEMQAEPTGLLHVDHIVGNVRVNEMNRWATYLMDVFDFKPIVTFGPGDITTKYSALLSQVVGTADGQIKNPINEPYQGLRKSQIEEFIDEYHGTGVQHIAIETDNIITSIQALRKNGVSFLTVPANYYDQLRQRNDDLDDQLKITENIDALQEHGILCDLEGEGYLLQLFTKPIGDRPTFFFEFIQRRNGAKGFGQGNFQALFQSIEEDQRQRGNLTRS